MRRTLSPDAFAVKASGCDLQQIGERMRAAREALGLTQASFNEQFGYGSVRSYQKNEAGINEAGICLAAAFIRAGINANWLLTGDGPMLLADLAPKPAPAPQINVSALSAIIRGLIEAGAPADKVGPTAWRYYTDAIEQGLITPEGIGDGGKAAA